MATKLKFETHTDEAPVMVAAVTEAPANSAPVLGYDQGFATGTQGYFDSSNYDSSYGTVTQEASGHNGIEAPDGDGFYAVVTQSDGGAGPFTRFGGTGSADSSADFVNGSQAEVKVYLDTSWSSGTSFQYTVAVNNSSGTFLRDFGFQVVSNGTSIEVGASNGASQTPVDPASLSNPASVSATGWYTLQQVFHDVGGVLSVDMNLIDANGTLTHVATLSNPADTIDDVGGARYGWFTQTNVSGGLAIDDSQLGAFDGQVTESATSHTAVSTSGAIPFTDADLSDTHTVSAVANGSNYIGTFTPTVSDDDSNGDGKGAVSWTYTAPAGSLDKLGSGSAIYQSYTVALDDGHGGTSSEVVTIKINGTDTVASHSGGFAVLATDAQPNYTTNLLSDTSDPDSTLSVTNLSVVLLDAAGKPIAPAPVLSYTLDSDGTFHFDTTQLNSLAPGQLDQVRVSYTVTGDAAGGDFSDFRIIAVQGTNDAPTVTPQTATVDETALPHNYNLLTGTHDPEGATLNVVTTGPGAPTVTVTTDAMGATPVTLDASAYTIASDGTFTLKPGTYTDMLHNGHVDTVTVNYEVSDGSTSTAKMTADSYTITVNGQPEQIYGNGTFSGTVYDDAIFGDSNPTTHANVGSTDDTISGLDGNDVIYGETGNDTLYGNAGDDQLVGGQGNDHLFGGQGNDILTGGLGDDVLEGGIGNDTLDGGAGSNTASYVFAPGAVTVNLNIQSADSDTSHPSQNTGSTGTDTLISIQNVIGSNYNDTIYGNSQGGTLQGGGGDDTIYAGDNGKLVVFNQNDHAYTAAAAPAGFDNTIYGNTGNDTLVGGNANDYLHGGQGDDIVSGGHGTNTLIGGAGIDTVTYANAESAVTVSLALQGDGASVAPTEQATYTYLDGSNTTQTVHDTLSGFENLTGSQYADTLTGDANANIIMGGDGADTIQGNAGDDHLYGNTGGDTIQGGDGNDYINGGQGDDTLYGNVGNDEIHGGLGNDYLHGGQGDDLLYGESGVNTLVGGLGADTFVLSYDANTNSSLTISDTITDFSHAQGDKIDLSGVDAIAGNASTNDHFTYDGAFFSGAAGSLIVIQAPDGGVGHYLVEGDTNGDGQADFIVHVNGATAPNASDFIGLATQDPQPAAVHHADLFG